MLLRKGGIREPSFKASRDARFLLFPTAFHTDKDLLQPAAAEALVQVSAIVMGWTLTHLVCMTA